MALVIKKWYASEVPNEDGNYVHLVGREAGLFAWLLSVIGLDPTTEIQIKDKLIIFSAASLSGRSTRVIPMQSITSAYYGYEKPWKEALLIAVLLSPVFFIGLLLGPLYYFLNKTLAHRRGGSLQLVRRLCLQTPPSSRARTSTRTKPTE